MDEFQARRLVNTYADTILRISYQYLKQTCDAEDICQHSSGCSHSGELWKVGNGTYL